MIETGPFKMIAYTADHQCTTNCQAQDQISSVLGLAGTMCLQRG